MKIALWDQQRGGISGRNEYHSSLIKFTRHEYIIMDKDNQEERKVFMGYDSPKFIQELTEVPI